MFLTEKQQAVLAFVREFIEDKGISPTLEEMSQYFGVSKVTIYEHVKALIEKGALKKEANRKRSIQLVEEEAPQKTAPAPISELRIRGRIAAGDFIEAVEDDQSFTLSDLSVDMDRCYMLRVEGDSMINDHICNGDLVVVEPADTARNNQIVVAVVPDDETGSRKATIKRFFQESDHIRLQPANDTLEPIRVPTCEIQGRVVGVVRARL